MPQQIQKDNASLPEKIRTRRRALKLLTEPAVVLEAYAGYGRLNRACYGEIADGVLLEKNPRKADILAQLRPAWGVFEGDTDYMLEAGIGREWPVNFVDFDPYGEPWPAIGAFFRSQRPWPQRLVVAVHDGLRNHLMIGCAWDVKSLAGVVDKYGNAFVADHYIEVIVPELLAQHAAVAGYVPVPHSYWGGYGGYKKQNTHYYAAFER